MDRFDAMRVFIRIVERRSFTRAADDLGLPRSSVTDAVKGLEARLGVSLLQRSTRLVSPTLDGEAYYRRCVNLISDLEDAEAGFTGVKPSGLVRIDVHGTQARHFLLPGLPRFLEAYPDIRLHIGETHQALDMVREGFDCMLRAGELTVESALIRRRLATLERGTFASPTYITGSAYPRPWMRWKPTGTAWSATMRLMRPKSCRSPAYLACGQLDALPLHRVAFAGQNFE